MCVGFTPEAEMLPEGTGWESRFSCAGRTTGWSEAEGWGNEACEKDPEGAGKEKDALAGILCSMEEMAFSMAERTAPSGAPAYSSAESANGTAKAAETRAKMRVALKANMVVRSVVEG